MQIDSVYFIHHHCHHHHHHYHHYRHYQQLRWMIFHSVWRYFFNHIQLYYVHTKLLHIMYCNSIAALKQNVHFYHHRMHARMHARTTYHHTQMIRWIDKYFFLLLLLVYCYHHSTYVSLHGIRLSFWPFNFCGCKNATKFAVPINKSRLLVYTCEFVCMKRTTTAALQVYNRGRHNFSAVSYIFLWLVFIPRFLHFCFIFFLYA